MYVVHFVTLCFDIKTYFGGIFIYLTNLIALLECQSLLRCGKVKQQKTP